MTWAKGVTLMLNVGCVQTVPHVCTSVRPENYLHLFQTLFSNPHDFIKTGQIVQISPQHLHTLGEPHPTPTHGPFILHITIKTAGRSIRWHTLRIVDTSTQKRANQPCREEHTMYKRGNIRIHTACFRFRNSWLHSMDAQSMLQLESV